jgi:hypothetical protein
VLLAFFALAASVHAETTFSFEGDIAPIFTRNGCNNSSCHGSLKGQNGFRLSVFGYDAAADYKSIVKDADGRRVDLKDPQKSLILLKPTFQVKHGGGVRFSKTSPEYKAILEWLKKGAPEGVPGPKLVSLTITPADEIFLTGADQTAQLKVTGRYADGVEKDLTHNVNYVSNDDSIAAVDASGLVTVRKSGETAIMVRSLGVVNAARVAVSLRSLQPKYQRPKSANYVDDFIFEKAERLRIVPSELTSDAEFLRRVSLDMTGTLPTPDKVRRFLADRSPDKRIKLIDQLFQDPDFADFWALKWGDQMGNTPNFLANGTGYYQWWLRKALADNMPYDEFARQLLTGLGDRYQVTPASYYPYLTNPLDRATAVAATFMGLSIECARCHDHPREKFKRADYLGLAAFFSQLSNKPGVRVNENYLFLDIDKQLYHPDNPKQAIPARFPGEGKDLTFEPGEDRRERLANWLTSPNNPYFAPTIVNRVWKQFMGRGLVEPEDFRITNPPSHPDLLRRLSQDFIQHGYNLRYLMKLIITSRTYQLSARVNETNQDDKTAFSHHYSRQLMPEQMLDAIVQVTGVKERFAAFPEGKRAIQLPDDQVENYFLSTFNRPSRINPSCTRDAAPTVTQALHLISGDTLQKKMTSDRGVLAKLLEKNKSDRAIVEHFTLAALTRMPTAQELELAEESVHTAASRRTGLEDYLWALLNSKEFLYNH